ncbi:MAG: preprotein translocase subunit SecG [Candidatus Mariimomonas ferrooxydans]
MYTALIVIHLIVCLFLIFIVLIQSSKGAEMGAAFGGSSQTIFGSRGAATFMNKLTTAVAVAFMVSSLTLAVFSKQRGSIMTDEVPVSEVPAIPFPDALPAPVQEQSATKDQPAAQEQVAPTAEGVHEPSLPPAE